MVGFIKPEFADTAMNELASRRNDTSPARLGVPLTDAEQKREVKCSWCKKNISNECEAWKQADAIFCSGPCFSESCHASFNPSKTCDWCSQVPYILLKFQVGSTNLKFCSEICVHKYKTHNFHQEMRAFLNVNPVASTQPSSTLITPDMWLKNRSASPKFTPPNLESEVTPKQEKPLISVVPLSKLMKQQVSSGESVNPQLVGAPSSSKFNPPNVENVVNPKQKKEKSTRRKPAVPRTRAAPQSKPRKQVRRSPKTEKDEQPKEDSSSSASITPNNSIHSSTKYIRNRRRIGNPHFGNGFSRFPPQFMSRPSLPFSPDKPISSFAHCAHAHCQKYVVKDEKEPLDYSMNTLNKRENINTPLSELNGCKNGIVEKDVEIKREVADIKDELCTIM